VTLRRQVRVQASNIRAHLWLTDIGPLESVSELVEQAGECLNVTGVRLMVRSVGNFPRQRCVPEQPSPPVRTGQDAIADRHPNREIHASTGASNPREEVHRAIKEAQTLLETYSPLPEITATQAPESIQPQFP
jgi:hypothetical protein